MSFLSFVMSHRSIGIGPYVNLVYTNMTNGPDTLHISKIQYKRYRRGNLKKCLQVAF